MIAAGLVLADSDSGKGSPIGLLVVLVLVVAVYFLWRSMNRHLKKVQASSQEQLHAETRADSSTTPEERPVGTDPDEDGRPKQS